jgi:hypothetical protein
MKPKGATNLARGSGSDRQRHSYSDRSLAVTLRSACRKAMAATQASPPVWLENVMPADGRHHRVLVGIQTGGHQCHAFPKTYLQWLCVALCEYTEFTPHLLLRGQFKLAF